MGGCVLYINTNVTGNPIVELTAMIFLRKILNSGKTKS